MNQQTNAKEAFEAYCTEHPECDPSACLHQDAADSARQDGFEIDSEDYYAVALRAAQQRVGMCARGEL